MNKEEILTKVRAEKGSISKTKLIRVLIELNLLTDVKNYFTSENIHESFYWWYYDLKEYPNKCAVCEKPLTSFKKFDIGYAMFETCGNSCAAMRKERIEKTKHTMLERYGVMHQMHLVETANKIKKTMMARYGIDNGLKLPAAKEGIQKKYGQNITNVSQTAAWKEKMRKKSLPFCNGENSTNSIVTLKNELGLTGDYNYQQLASWKRDGKTMSERCLSKGFELVNVSYPENTLILKHLKCDSVAPLKLSDYDRWRCVTCAPLKYSKFELEVRDFLNSLDVEFIMNDRKQIYPFELDFFIESHKIAIECNGDYWHSFNSLETREERNKHLAKLERAQATGITLIQITEHEWNAKSEILKSIIAVKLGKAERIFARKIVVAEISTATANAFCDTHHIQGGCSSSFAIGAFYDNKLVACITVGKNRFKKNNELELIRFATFSNTVIVGGFSKMLSALRGFGYSGPVTSYLDRRIFDGHSLIKSGWELSHTSNPGYCWLVGDQRISRNKTQKHRLEKLLGDDFIEGETEYQNMFRVGARRLWDCGQHVFTTIL